jgi:hypothetical protein
MSQTLLRAGLKSGVVGICLATIVFGMTGCESGSHASKGATQGAKTGAVSGAVGGLVSALVFGGDPIDRAARGAVYGGTTGAVAGGMAGSSRDKAEKQAKKQTRDAEIAKLKEEIGPDAFAGLSALAECRHDEVHGYAKRALQSENPNYSLSGLWLEVLTYADQKDEAKARSLFPELVKKDWEIKTEDEAETAMRDALSDLMGIRQEYGLPRVCPS